MSGTAANTTTSATNPVGTSEPRLIEVVLTSAGIGCVAGGIAGFLWGGIGGRVAMRVVLLTSNDSVRGLTSDDGFEIGRISGASIFLLIFTTVLGAIAGLLYGLLRMVTAGPTWAVAIGTTLAVAAAGGAAVVHEDGVDFRVLDPLWLTVGLFVLLPGLWALTVVVVTQRIIEAGVLVPAAPALTRRRYWGATGWVVLVVITALGVRGLVGDISALTS